MTTPTDLSKALRSRRLHREIERRVLDLFDQGHFEEAVVNSFKVLEERLRDVTGTSGQPDVDPVTAAFNPTSGVLNDPQAQRGELEARYLLFRGSFGSFRNDPAHRFTDPTPEAAFDVIVLVNRLICIAEVAAFRTRPPATSDPIGRVVRFESEDGLTPVTLDVDDDGQDELVVPTRHYITMGDIRILRSGPEPIEVFDFTTSGLKPARVEPAIGNDDVDWKLLELSLADVDGDGKPELVCVLGGRAWVDMLLYKHRDGHYDLLCAESPTSGGPLLRLIREGRLADTDGDGGLEVVAEPWLFVPVGELAKLLPPGTAVNDGSFGRVRFVWKWDASRGQFRLIQRRLLYLGTRGVDEETWAAVRDQDGSTYSGDLR